MSYKTVGGFVYFVQAQPNGLIKIGWSMKPRKRLRAIQACSPVPLVLLGVVHGTLETEGEMHERFAHLRGDFEWFSPDEDLLFYIRAHASMTPIMTRAEKLAAAVKKHREQAEAHEAKRSERQAALTAEIEKGDPGQAACDARLAARQRRAAMYAGLVR